MSTQTTTLERDDDPLGGVLLEPEMTFGLRAATLAGHAPGLTGSGDWWEIIISTGTANCSGCFTPAEPDHA